MGRLLDRGSPNRWRWVLAVALLELAWPIQAGAARDGQAQVAVVQDTQSQVLVLYSTRRDAEIATIVDRELPKVLAPGVQGRLDFYSEYIDLSRFPDPLYQAGFRDFLHLKYAGRRFDLIVAVQDVAVEFLARNRSELFPGVPLVFLANGRPRQRPENATGLIATLSFGGTLDLALALQPAVRHVFIVSGASARDKVYETAARAQLQRFSPSVTLTYLAGLPTNDLEARLAKLPANSIVYYLLVYQDGANEFFAPLEFLERVTTVANAPVYCWVDSAIGHGIVGGRLRDQRAQATALGQLALRVLQGESADSIPLSSPDIDVTQVDWRQLERWGISEARVPAGTVVSFREPTAWERYQRYIIGGIAILLLQTALIAGLLVQGRRRQRAEAEVRGREAQLRTSNRRIKDLASRLLGAQENERSRIARELHDDISQQLALLTIDLELLERGRGPARLDGRFDEVVNRAHEIAASVHDLSHRLHPAKLRLVGLTAALEALQREVSLSDIDVTFTHDDIPRTLSPELTLCLFRIVQEALQNAMKYSEAKRIAVQLSRAGQGLTLSIVDDGIGFDVNAAWGTGLGLVSMRERLDAIGGTLEIYAERGLGTRLKVWAPVAVKAEETHAAAV